MHSFSNCTRHGWRVSGGSSLALLAGAQSGRQQQRRPGSMLRHLLVRMDYCTIIRNCNVTVKALRAAFRDSCTHITIDNRLLRERSSGLLGTPSCKKLAGRGARSASSHPSPRTPFAVVFRPLICVRAWRDVRCPASPNYAELSKRDPGVRWWSTVISDQLLWTIRLARPALHRRPAAVHSQVGAVDRTGPLTAEIDD
jgi:hypothetical protein